MMADTSDAAHFARVQPIVGDTLRQMRVAAAGLPAATPLVTYLAASGVRRWLWAETAAGDGTQLAASLQAHHGPALDLAAEIQSWSAWGDVVRREAFDLIIAVDGAVSPAVVEVAVQTATPLLLVRSPRRGRSGLALSFLPGDDPALLTSHLIPPSPLDGGEKRNPPGPLDGREKRDPPGPLDGGEKRDFPGSPEGGVKTAIPPSGGLGGPAPNSTSFSWDWLTMAPLGAGLARGMLLRETPQARLDLARLWSEGRRGLTWEEPGWPLTPRWVALDEVSRVTDSTGSPFHTPPAQRGTLLIAGLGSLGSVAALPLAAAARRLVIIDPERVDVYNPVRQAYPVSAIGQPKATVLAEQVRQAGAGEVIALERAVTTEAEMAQLIETHEISAALIVTGTPADFPLARALRAADVPHVVGRCYPRARYWEGIIVDGQRGPSFDEVRGQVPTGPAAPPTPEQTAAYSDAGALEAEPATLIESGWAALWLARLMAQCLAPPGLRERWFLELLAAEQTCLIGGVGVEETAAGVAYGIDVPGQVRAWGRANIRRAS